MRLRQVSAIDGKTAICDCGLPDSPQRFLDSLGGTIKICEVIGRLTDAKKCQDFISQYLINNFSGARSKVNFGISTYTLSNKHEISLKTLLKNSKISLQQNGIKSRFVNKTSENVANTAIQDSGLLRHGVELCIFEGKEIFIGRTVAVQDFKSYGFRDFERPARDQRSGMLPPKLAQVMINISGAKKGSTIYDPFCGSGTILMEGLLLGMNVTGSDISEKAVSNSVTNLKWLEQNFRFQGKWEVFAKDATKKCNEVKADAIVAETYLGPPTTKEPDETKAKEILEEAAKIIFAFLENLQTKAEIVLAVPFIRSQNRNLCIENFIEKAEKLGYSVLALDNDKKSLLYDRPDQFIGREIFKLKSGH